MTEVNYCNTCPSVIRGLCCWHSTIYIDAHVAHTPCMYLNKAGRCKIYKNRFEINPKCYSVEKALQAGALPLGCEYVNKSNIKTNIPYKTRVRR